MADEEAEAFARCLLGDIFVGFSRASELDIETSSYLKEDRCVPKLFYAEVLDLSKPFINVLMSDISNLPVLLYSSEDFFKRFAYSVCLKLSRGQDDEQISFLKVTVFLVVLSATSFVNRCYRLFDDIPDIYHRMLRDHLTTKFYKENKFEEMASKSKELQSDEKWISKTIDEIRRVSEESCGEELAVTKLSDYSSYTYILRILDLRNPVKQSDVEEVRCPYCGIECILLLKVFFQPRIKYKPEC